METQQYDMSILTSPFLDNEKKHKQGEIEAEGDDHGRGTSSTVLETCFHGLNESRSYLIN